MEAPVWAHRPLTIPAQRVTTIRPNIHPQTHTRPQNQDSAKLAQQRAFFNAAMGQAQTPAQAAAAPVAPTASGAPAPTQRTASIPAEQPQKVLRPGSLIDIRV
jgi:hypothetical protein